MKKFLLFFLLLSSCSSDEFFRQFYSSMYLNEGNRLFTEGDYDAAVASYDKAVRLKPAGDNLVYALSQRGLAQYYRENYADAARDMTRVIELAPGSDTPYVLRGICRALSTPGVFNRDALADFDRAISLNPTNAESYYNRGNLYFDRKQPLKAIENYDQALRLTPDDADILTRRADMEMLLGLADQALLHYTRALVLEPLNRAATEGRSKAFFALGDVARGTKDQKRARELALIEAKSWWKDANRELSRGRTARAVKAYTRSLELDPAGAAGSGVQGDTYFDRGIVFYYDRMYDRAAMDMVDAVRLNPRNAKARTYLGMCTFEFGDYPRAETHLRSSLQLNPDDPLALVFLGRTFLAQGEARSAADTLTKAVQANPNLPDAWAGRGDAWLSLQEYRKAAEDYNLAIEKGWPDTGIYLKRGDAFYGLGLFDDAVADYTEYLKSASVSNVPAGHLARGNAFYDMKKYALAYRDYSLFLSAVTNTVQNRWDRKTVNQVLTNMERCINVVIRRRPV